MVVYEYKTTEDFDYEDFLRELNENAVTKEFLDSCKKTKKLFEKPKTNADRIRSMTDEELAEFLEKSDFWDEICDECKHLDRCQDFIFCTSKTLEWLKKR